MSSLILIVPLRFLSTILTKKLTSSLVRIPLSSASITWVLKSEVDIRCGPVKPVNKGLLMILEFNFVADYVGFEGKY